MLPNGPIMQFLGGLSLGTRLLVGILTTVVVVFAIPLIWPPEDSADVPFYIFALLLPLSVPAYLVAQTIVLLRSSGCERGAAALPLAVMIPLFVQSAIALAHESNLWFLNLYLASPV